MAVGRLSGAWIRAVLAETYAEGVARRALLDHFAVLLVSPRARRGAKGRLARRLYGTLLKLQLRGHISQESGVIRPLAAPVRTPSNPPELAPLLERKLFQALLAEDGQGDGHTPGSLRLARREFLRAAVETGWTLTRAAALLGIRAALAEEILEK
jgi:hypothetical protein